MAKTNAYYVVEYKKEEEQNVCFLCAIKSSTNSDVVKIYLDTTDYEFIECDMCGDFIRDRISI